MVKYAQLVVDFSKSQKFSSPQQAKNMLKDIIGKTYEWKVGDMDKSLNENLIFQS